MATAAYETARKVKESIQAGAVRIILPAYENLPQKTLYLGTTRFEVDGEDYRSRLDEMPVTSGQRGLGQDYSEFAVNDPQMKLYDEIKPYEPVFEDSAVTVKECLLTKDQIFESEIVLEGFIEKFALSESDLKLKFSVLSDMSRSGFKVGGRILTQRYCGATFNVNGLKSPEFDPCGWQTAQGGNPLFCTHRAKGPEGCEDHNNLPRMVAVEAMTSAEVQIVSSGSGWSYGTNPCFGIETLIWMADGSYKPIGKIKKGDLVWSFTPSGEIVRAKVKKTFFHWTDETLLQNWGKKRFLETTEPHYFLIGKDRFKPAGEIETGETVRVIHDADWFEMVLRGKVKLEMRRKVFNFNVQRWQTYFVVVAGIKIAVHNSKQPTEII